MPRTGALRELEEETGIPAALVEVIARAAANCSTICRPICVGKLWKGRYRGQRQIWFLMRFLGTDADVEHRHRPPRIPRVEMGGRRPSCRT